MNLQSISNEYKFLIPKIYNSKKTGKLEGIDGEKFLDNIAGKYENFNEFMDERIHCEIGKGYLTGKNGKKKKIHWDFIRNKFYAKDGSEFNHLDYLDKREKAMKKVVNSLMKKVASENINDYKDKNIQVNMNLQQYEKGLLDLHTHSTYSDGGDSPSELVRKAKEQGITALALTDHHTASGIPEFMKACKEYDILGIFGFEISAELPKEILIDTDNEAPDLVILGKNPKKDPLKDYQKIYLDYQGKIFLPQTLEKLIEEGFDIPKINIKKEAEKFHCPHPILMNFTNYSDNLDKLVKYVKDRDPKAQEEDIRKRPFGFAVNFLYSVGCPAYVQRMGNFNVDDAVNLADAMNCRLIIAHPGGDFGWLREPILNYFVSKGIKAMEVRNYYNSEKQNSFFDEYVKKNNLVRSGGSDYHGEQKRSTLGMTDRPENQLPKEILQELWDSLPN